MHPADCPAFDYEDHPSHPTELFARTKDLVRSLRIGQLDKAAVAADSRVVHEHLFSLLTPPACAYFAGHYRGENFRCLRYYGVHVAGDRRVGLNPVKVPGVMMGIGAEIIRAMARVDELHAQSRLALEDLMYWTVRFACVAFERVLTIHPYANGNGHAARFVIWAILGRYDYWPADWPIDPRPARPDYESSSLRRTAQFPTPLWQPRAVRSAS